ncbi:MAG: hypothetical protein WC413_03390 [Candidatus Nanoarchaeia archaeon]
MKEINKIIIAMFMIVITILIVPASVYSVEDMTINPTFPTSAIENNLDNQDLGEAIIVNVVNYQPPVIASSLIESRNVPVVVYLEGSTLGSLFMQENSPESEPFIGQPIIKSGYVSVSGSTEYLASQPQFIMPQTYARSLDNMGYIYLLLKQVKDETKVPEKIDLNLTLKLYFDFNRGFGDVSAQDLILKESSVEEDWKKTDSISNSFWNGKGYLRVTKIEGNRAYIQVYGSGFGLLGIGDASELERRGIVVLTKGDSRTMSLPGSSSFFNDRFTLKLNEVSEPEDTAQLKVTVNGEQTTKTIARGMKIYSGSNWIIDSISNDTTEISCKTDANCPSGLTCYSGKCVSAGSAQKLTTQQVIIRNSYGDIKILYRTYNDKATGETETLILSDKVQVEGIENNLCDKNILQETPTLNDLVKSNNDKNDNDNAMKLYCTSIQKLKDSIKDAGDNQKYTYYAYDLIGQNYERLSDILPVNTDSFNAKKIAIYYYGHAEQTNEITTKIAQLKNDLYTNSKSEMVYLEDEGAFVSLVDIIPVAEADKSTAELTIGGVSGIYREGEPISILDGTSYQFNSVGEKLIWYIDKIDSNTVYLSRKRQTKSTLGVTSEVSEQTVYINPGKATTIYKDIGTDGKPVQNSIVDISLKKINSKKRAYVTVYPGTGEAYSTSNFQVHLGVDKRMIEWTPEQIDKMINATQKQIDQLSKFIKQLDDIIKVWKNVCMVTYGLLIVKNAFTAGAADRALARKEVMPMYNDECKKEILSSPEKKTMSQCLTDKADEIESTLNVAEGLVGKRNDCLTSKDNSCLSGIDLYDNDENKKIIENAAELNKNALIANPVDKAQFLDYQFYCVDMKNENLGIDEYREDKCDDAKNSIKNKLNAYDAAYEKSNIGTTNFNELSANKKTEATSRFQYLYNLALGVLDTNAKISPEDEKRYINQFNNEFGIDAKNVKIEPLVSETNIETGITATTYSTNIDSTTGKVTITDSGTYKLLKVSDAPENVKNIICSSESTKKTCLDSEWKFQGYNVYKDTTKDDKYIIALQSLKSADSGLNDKYAQNAKAEFIEKGKPFCLPTGSNGNFVKILSWYEYGTPNDCEYWNVGADGLLCSGEDRLIAGKDVINTREDTKGLCQNLVAKYKSSTCTEGGSLMGSLNPNTNRPFLCSMQGYKLAQSSTNANCQDFMDPDDCKTLFAVCDPVMCPNSRFNLGGNYEVSGSVVETGIIGSLVLGMPNYPETPLPICLPGISAGLKSIRSLLEGFVQCLHTSKINHENIGICDKIRSLGICELLWKEIINTFNMQGGLINFISEKMFGINSGGSEYLDFTTNMETTSNMVNYFTKEYASSAFSAYNAMSTQEFGTKICKAAIFGKFAEVGSLLDQISEPENPPQFYAEFDESPYITEAGNIPSTGTNKLGNLQEMSLYNVYFHIYAGSIPEALRTGVNSKGVKYAVYLVDDQGYSIPVTSEQRGSAYEIIEYGKYADKNNKVFDKPGMTKICVSISGSTECGFGKVTTNYALNALNDEIVQNEAARKITSQKQCVPDSPTLSTSLGSVVLPEEYGAISTGIVRTCSTINPGSGTNANDWSPIAGSTCGKDKSGNDLGICWINTKTIDIKNKEKREDVMNAFALNKKQMDEGTAKYNEILAGLFDVQKSKAYFAELESKLSLAKENKNLESKKEILIGLLSGNDFKGFNKEKTEKDIPSNNEAVINYVELSQYSLDTSIKIWSQIRVGEIYMLLGDTIKTSIERVECGDNVNECLKGFRCVEKKCVEETINVNNKGGGGSETTESDCTKVFDPAACLFPCIWKVNTCNNPATQTVLSNTQKITIKEGEMQKGILKDFPEFWIKLESIGTTTAKERKLSVISDSEQEIVEEIKRVGEPIPTTASIILPKTCFTGISVREILYKDTPVEVYCKEYNKRVQLNLKGLTDNTATIEVKYLASTTLPGLISKCSDCGNGALNTCDKEECNNEKKGSDCYATYSVFGSYNFFCSDCGGKCESFNDLNNLEETKLLCMQCDKTCILENNKCKPITPLDQCDVCYSLSKSECISKCKEKCTWRDNRCNTIALKGINILIRTFENTVLESYTYNTNQGWIFLGNSKRITFTKDFKNGITQIVKMCNADEHCRIIQIEKEGDDTTRKNFAKQDNTLTGVTEKKDIDKWLIIGAYNALIK